MSYVNDWTNESSPAAIDVLEKAYLGGCILVPSWLDFGASLRADHFKVQARGFVFDTMRSFPRRAFDAELLAVALDKSGRPAPAGSWGWCVGHLLDVASAHEDLMPQYVRCIKEAAALRRAERSAA